MIRLVLVAIAVVSMTAATPAHAEEIPLQQGQSKLFSVPVNIGGRSFSFYLDTGATGVSLPFSVGMSLVRSGAAAIADGRILGGSTLADGSVLRHVNIVIREIRVGSHTATDVPGTIALTETADMLLGQEFLSRFGTATLDYNRHVLILGETPPPVGAAAPDVAADVPSACRVDTLAHCPHVMTAGNDRVLACLRAWSVSSPCATALMALGRR
jgi:hypothetical protein